MSKTITHVAFDADDTLWKNEDHFLEIGKKFRDLLGPKYQNVQNRFYQIEEKNLRYFGYGAKGYTLSLIETALELTNNEIDGHTIHKIIDWCKEMVEKKIQLLPGVRETLRILKKEYFLVLITKGDLFEQEMKIARSGLAEEFEYIKIVSEKNDASYASIFHVLQIEPHQFFMVGNSLKSDVAPVVRLGGKAAHIPYTTTWVQELLSEEEKEKIDYYTLESVAEVPPFLQELNSVLLRKKNIAHENRLGNKSPDMF